MKMPLLIVTILLTAIAGTAGAQVIAVPPLAAPTTQAPVPAPSAAAAVAPDYQVGPLDLLNITVYGEPTMSGRIRVDNDGSFPFQYLNRVKAEGLTPAEIEAYLTKALSDGYLRNPQVSVEIVEYRSQSVFVTGEVRAPNKYTLPGNSTLMDVLTQAGSVTSTAGNWVHITHARKGVQAAGPSASAEYDLRVNLRDIQTGKTQNVKVEDGDTIFVPRAERVFVTGEVRNNAPLVYEEGMTVFQAVSLAGGITEKGANRFAIRRLIKGQIKEIDARAEDKLQPGDQVVVKRRRL
jgi:polysaccharide export outer membrane protein